MSHARSDDDLIRTTHNTARFFTENRQVGWVLLVMAFLWGWYAYSAMPKRKDPDIPANVAVAICPWPGASAERIEQLVTRKIEERIAENAAVRKIESISRTSVSIVILTLDQRVTEPGDEFDDVRLKLDLVRDLPQGAGPIEFRKDFGNTVALMLAVASPPVSEVGLSLRGRAVGAAVAVARSKAASPGPRASLVVCFPESISPAIPQRQRDLAAYLIRESGVGRDVRPFDGSGFTGIDLETPLDDGALLAAVQAAVDDRLHPSEFHPDTWPVAVIRDPAQAAARLATVAADKYSYRELDDLSDLVKRTLQNVPQVSKIMRAGLLEERVFLEYSQERLAGLQRSLPEILGARNITLPGGMLDVQGKQLRIDPSGEFTSERDLGDVIVGQSASRRPLYLRNSVEIMRGYETPARYLNFYRWQDASGAWHRSRAITLAVQMRPGEQIEAFGRAVDAALDSLRGRIPEDLVLARVSDQPLQVREGIELFSQSLWEAIVLVVLVALVGFWEWRSATLMALSIPLTLALTFGAMHLLQIDIQQVSLVSLIIALGLLVDDPVVAGDAIKRELDAGHPPILAAWLGPTKLATAILFATITNIVAYLPLLLVSGSTGRFLYSLPVVLACSLVMSRLVSMAFIPMLAYYLLKPSRRPSVSPAERRRHGLGQMYDRTGRWALEHRWLALALAVLMLAGGVLYTRQLKTQFFPTDLQYLSYVDVWLPEDATLPATNQAARQAEQVIQEVADRYGREHAGADGAPRRVLESIATYVGGGAPRFWLSVIPELLQSNYAQIVIKVVDKHDTAHLAPLLQQALSSTIAGARIDLRQLETGKPVGIPVAVRLSGGDIPTLRRLGDELQAIFRAVPAAARVRDDWGAESFAVALQVDPDRANMAGVTNQEVALSAAAGMTGFRVTTLREGDKQIPVVARLRVEERARLSDIRNLYVYSASSPMKVPLGQVSTVTYGLKTEKIRRRNQFRTVTVSCFPHPGVLPSEVLAEARPQLAAFESRLPPGYRIEIGGEHEERVAGFAELAVVMLISVGAIFLALVFQFRDAVKPLIVFSAIPFGAVGGLAALVLHGAPFGFMAFLGVASLVGVIVSHVIVLFDFIEEAHQRGEPLEEALLDAGIVRLRPVLITVGATVFALVPLSMHGGPLWQPLCYVQIGGLLVATGVTLLLVPVLYAICVLDLKVVRWERVAPEAPAAH
jgi:multidrug efflux pump subunit AcrB